MPIEFGGGAVHFADPCAGSAADDRQAQRTAETRSQFVHLVFPRVAERA
jgi:hypothetical protein